MEEECLVTNDRATDRIAVDVPLERRDWQIGPVEEVLRIKFVIANEFNEVSSDTYLSALIYCGLILFILTAAVNTLAYFSIRRLAGSRGFKA